MKSILFVTGILLGSNAFATTISLPPGSQAVINPGDTAVVRCEGSPIANAPRCAIVADGENYDIKQGNDVVGVFGSLDSATAEVQNLRKAGVCP
jgi:hypothetical protein